MENAKSRIFGLGDISQQKEWLGSQQLQTKVQRCHTHPAEEVSEGQVQAFLTEHRRQHDITAIYTDGSKTEHGVGAGFCAYEDNHLVHTDRFKLHNDNSVFQAELVAIERAVDWLNKNPKTTPAMIYSDSLSSLQALLCHKNKNPQVLTVKNKIKLLFPRVKLAHVKAHVGHEGNELADSLAKEATTMAEQTESIPLPRSHLKRLTSQKRMEQWQSRWDSSEKGRHAHGLLPKVKIHDYHLDRTVTAFLSGHGPFPTYLFKYTVSRTEDCDCGAQGTPLHYYFECPLTQQWHLQKPHSDHWDFWTRRVINSKAQRLKLKNIYLYLQDLMSNR